MKGTATTPPAGSRRRHRVLLPLLGVAALAFVRLRGAWPIWVDFHRWLAGQGVPAPVRNLDATLVMILVPLGAAWVVSRFRWRAALDLLGLTAPIARALVAAALFAFPMFLVAALSGGGPRLSPSLIPGTVIAPFTEELFFRGMLCALLVRAGGWRFWPAAIFGGVLFGAAHISWTSVPSAGSLVTFLVTGAGGVWFAWLLMRWRWNLWVPILLHAGMNLSWLLFGVGGGAVGGLVPNLGRAATIALATVATLHPAWFRLPPAWTEPPRDPV